MPSPFPHPTFLSQEPLPAAIIHHPDLISLSDRLLSQHRMLTHQADLSQSNHQSVALPIRQFSQIL